MRPGTVIAFLLIGCSGIFAQTVTQPEEENLKFFRDIAETRSFTLGRPIHPSLTPDGSALLFLRGGSRDPVLRLYQMQVSTGKVEELLTPEALLKGTEEKLSVKERARRERMRMTLQGFTDFDLSEDGQQILLVLSGRLYVINRLSRKVIELPQDGWIDPSFSRDGRFVAAVRDDELFVIPLTTVKAHQITVGASETVTHGLAEFAAEEEMDRHHGYWWSPDAKWIAYQETDVSQVEKHYVFNPLVPEEPPECYYYPRAGTANARVRLGVISRQGGPTTWIRWDAGKYPYLARVTWSESAPLTILVQTRDQREEKLLSVDPGTGHTSELFTEKDPAWLNLDSNTRIPFWLDDGTGFLWTTERRGGWQLELRARDGSLIRELTSVGCECTNVIDVDAKTDTVIASGGPDPRDTQIYRISLAGAGAVPITQESGSHQATYSRDHSTYVHTFNLSDGKWGAEVRSREGAMLAPVPSVAETPASLPRVELTRVGEHEFYASILRPAGFRPDRKYPVILSEYAGPTDTVVSSVPQAYLKDQWLADQGFIVVSLDGRGTPGRGREWERIIKGNLIDIPLEDQVDGLMALGSKYPEMDMTRVGVTGWSFGGYFAAMATIRRPDVFQCGVAGAPVVDWEYYDTHYTERYMDLPTANPEGYKRASVLTYAADLKRPLLIIHGLTDDNVYFEHTLKLVESLFASGRNFELLPLLGTHLVPDPVVQFRQQTRILDFFRRHLQARNEAP